jgi:hypothetical protein
VSIFSAIFNRSVASYEEAFQASDITSEQMKAAISEWFDLYFQKAPTDQEDPCQQIPYTIVHKLTKTAFSEYTATGKDEFARCVLKALDKKRKKAMQMSLIGGESYLKPIPSKGGFRFGVVNRLNMLVFGRDDEGSATDIGTFEHSVRDAKYYSLLERRTVNPNGFLTIRNMLYCSDSRDTLGKRVPLASHPVYEKLPEEYVFPSPIGSIGMARIQTPIENCVDGTDDAVSVYAPAVGLIHNINRNEAQLNGEFERGESRIITSADILSKQVKTDVGKVTYALKDHVFVGLEEDPETIGINIFSPALREKSFLARKQDYLRSAESIIGLKRGLLSEVEATERTAKEITSSEGDYNLTIIDFQQMWETAAHEALRLCGILGQMYNISGAHDIADDTAIFNWGNGVLFDEEETRKRMLSEVQAGLLQPERYVGFVYKQPCDTPAQREKIRKDYMPQLIEEEE